MYNNNNNNNNKNCSRRCDSDDEPGQPTRALSFGSSSRAFPWSGREGQSFTCYNRRQRLLRCATNHKVVSVRDIKRTEGTEHSPVQGGRCSEELLFISTNTIRWDGQTKHCLLEFKSLLVKIRIGRVN